MRKEKYEPDECQLDSGQSVWDSPRGGEACTSHSFQKVLLHTFMIDRDTHFYLSSFIEHSMKLFMFRKLTRLQITYQIQGWIIISSILL
jgi:hypothetical protein